MPDGSYKLMHLESAKHGWSEDSPATVHEYGNTDGDPERGGSGYCPEKIKAQYVRVGDDQKRQKRLEWQKKEREQRQEKERQQREGREQGSEQDQEREGDQQPPQRQSEGQQ